MYICVQRERAWEPEQFVFDLERKETQQKDDECSAFLTNLTDKFIDEQGVRLQVIQRKIAEDGGETQLTEAEKFACAYVAGAHLATRLEGDRLIATTEPVGVVIIHGHVKVFMERKNASFV